jgi:signal peptidase I
MSNAPVSPGKIIGTALIIFFCLFFLVQLFIIDIKLVYGHSMEPVLARGDLIFVNKLAYGFFIPFKKKYIIRWSLPEKGDIVLFKNPEEGTMVIKRCIGVEGDRIDYNDKTLYIAGNEIPYNPMEHYTFDKTMSHVPQGTIVVVGDNYQHSIDSRHFGFIRVSSVYGKIIQLW